MHSSESLKILFHVSRYWPAVAGAALHTREMIRHLQKQHQISVILVKGESQFNIPQKYF